MIDPERLATRKARRLVGVAAATGVVFAAACGDGSSAQPVATAPGGATTAASPSAPNATPTRSGVVGVSGNRLLRDGAAWVPHAVQLVAFVAPPRRQTGAFLAAYRHYSVAQFTAIKAWGADSVRMQLSQPGADPDDPNYDADFVDQYVAGVHAARAAGLTVIVSIQDEKQSGEERPARLPNAATIRVWRALAPRLNGDDGIIYEPFNEPQLKPSPAAWAAWRVAMGNTAAAIRATGATNVLLADGLNFAATLDGFVPLPDPLRRVAYSSHPYFYTPVDQTEEAWTRRFGAAAAKVPVIVGEWTSATTYNCDAATPAAARAFLQYIASHDIGLVAVTYDFGLPRYGGIVRDYDGTPTTFAGGLRCGDVGFGPGTLVQTWYRTGTVPGSLR